MGSPHAIASSSLTLMPAPRRIGQTKIVAWASTSKTSGTKPRRSTPSIARHAEASSGDAPPADDLEPQVGMAPANAREDLAAEIEDGVGVRLVSERAREGQPRRPRGPGRGRPGIDPGRHDLDAAPPWPDAAPERRRLRRAADEDGQVVPEDSALEPPIAGGLESIPEAPPRTAFGIGLARVVAGGAIADVPHHRRRLERLEGQEGRVHAGEVHEIGPLPGKHVTEPPEEDVGGRDHPERISAGQRAKPIGDPEPERIHHDLDAAAERLQIVLGLGPGLAGATEVGDLVPPPQLPEEAVAAHVAPVADRIRDAVAGAQQLHGRSEASRYGVRRWGCSPKRSTEYGINRSHTLAM